MTKTAAKRQIEQRPVADPPEADIIGLEEAARLLDLPPNVLSLRTERGDLPATVTDGRMMFHGADLTAFKATLEQQRAAQRELADITEELMSVYGL